MIVRYDSLDRLEPPQLLLCNPGSVYNDGALSKFVGVLSDHEAEEIVFNFNSTSQLNFRVNRVTRDDPEENLHGYNMYKAVQNRRLIFINNIGYFMITNIEDDYDGTQHKDVTAESIEVEIQQKMVPYIENGTHRFFDGETENEKGILQTIVDVLPLWGIGHVDESLKDKWRTFEDVDVSKNCLGFMLEDLQDAYECIFIFDTVHRLINVYAQDTYVRQTDIHITKDDVINSLNITENADDLYTAISVQGGENITIGAVNPTGSNTIYNFSYYLDWMSPALSQKVREWQDAVSAAELDCYNANLAYYTALAELSGDRSEVERLSQLLSTYTTCRNNIVARANTALVDGYNTYIIAAGGKPIQTSTDVATVLSDIDNEISIISRDLGTAQRDYDIKNEEVENLRATAESFHEQYALSAYFADDKALLDELDNYIFEGSYNDEYVVITDIMGYAEKFEQMSILYNRAKAQLERVSEPSQEFNIDAENFLFVKEFEHWSNQLETGCIINVELNSGDAVVSSEDYQANDIALLFLSSITVNYDDHTLSMTFGNRFNKYDPKSLFEDMLGNVSKSANTLNYIKETLYPIKSGEFDYMKEEIATSRVLTMNAALASNNEETTLDGSGLTIKERLQDSDEYDPRQVKLTGKSLVFTNDAWNTADVAIGEIILDDNTVAYGVNAQTLIGDIIIGNELHIKNSDGTDILTAVDDSIETHIGAGSELDSRIKQTEDKLNVSFRTVTQDGNEAFQVNSVVTENGFRFDKDGLNIYNTASDINNQLNNEGMFVRRVLADDSSDTITTEDILTADTTGVNALNLTARQYLIVGQNSRFEDYLGSRDEHRTGCFFVGDRSQGSGN